MENNSIYEIKHESSICTFFAEINPIRTDLPWKTLKRNIKNIKKNSEILEKQRDCGEKAPKALNL